MQIKVKKFHDSAVIPKYAYAGDAAVDLVAIASWEDDCGNLCYGTGLAIEIPVGHVGLLFPRSSVSNTNLRLCNSVGVIDSGYRGEIMLKFDRRGFIDKQYSVGDRVGQLMIVPIPSVEYVETSELNISDRNTGGYGSSGT